jgi:hypothetical protein
MIQSARASAFPVPPSTPLGSLEPLATSAIPVVVVAELLLFLARRNVRRWCALPERREPVKTYAPRAITNQCAYTITHPGPRTSNGSSILTPPSVGRS